MGEKPFGESSVERWFYIESHEGNESQEGLMNTGIHGLVYILRIICRSSTCPFHD